MADLLTQLCRSSRRVRAAAEGAGPAEKVRTRAEDGGSSGNCRNITTTNPTVSETNYFENGTVVLRRNRPPKAVAAARWRSRLLTQNISFKNSLLVCNLTSTSNEACEW